MATYPQVIVEAGFVPSSPGIGNLTLLLDDPTFGILDTDELGSTDTWTDISKYVQDGHVDRVSTRQQGPFVVYQGGTATFTLNNADGRFDPENLAGPYVAAGVTQVRPMIPVRVRAIWAGVTYYLFQGFATSWIPPTANFGPVYDQTVLTCGDAFRIFSGVNLATLGSPVGANELSGARISRILTSAGWYSSAHGMSVIDTGQSQMQATSYGSDALSLMQLTADSELGEMWMDGQGRLVFRNRHAILQDANSSTIQGVFGKGDVYFDSYTDTYGFALEATSLSRPDDDTTMINDVQATRVGGTLQEVTNAASVAKFLFPRTYARADLILTTDSETLNWAQYVGQVAASDEFRMDTVTITPGVDPVNLWPQALGRDLSDRIQVWKNPPNVAAYSLQLFIRGISHTFTPAWWQTTWTTQNAARYAFFTLDSHTLGILDTDALAY